MKQFFIVISVIIWSISCSKQKVSFETHSDFEIITYKKYSFDNTYFKEFVDDYISLPENNNRQVFTLYIDQRMDTLLFTLWRTPKRTIDLEYSMGYFFCKGKAIIIYSPFDSFLKIMRSQKDQQIISNQFSKELEYYKNHRQELVMWQLQYLFYDKSFRIDKNFNRIINTIKAPIPDSIKIDIQYQAD